MAKIGNLRRLFQALAQNDLGLARLHAGEIATSYEKNSQYDAAKTLRNSLSTEIKPNRGKPLNEGSILLSGRSRPSTIQKSTHLECLAEIQLPTHLKSATCAILAEWKYRNVLRARGIKRRTTLLFHGPPGCGKTATTRALAREMGVQHYVVRFDSLFGAYLGQTASRLRELFDFAERTPCVLVFDEIDALGKSRGNPMDVGELDRIVIAIMQELEHSEPKGLLIGTSNLPEHLDRALWRRFNSTLDFPSPKRKELIEFVHHQSERYSFRSKNKLKHIPHFKSYADAEQWVTSLVRNEVINHAEASSKRKP